MVFLLVVGPESMLATELLLRATAGVGTPGKAVEVVADRYWLDMQKMYWWAAEATKTVPLPVLETVAVMLNASLALCALVVHLVVAMCMNKDRIQTSTLCKQMEVEMSSPRWGLFLRVPLRKVSSCLVWIGDEAFHVLPQWRQNDQRLEACLCRV